MGAAFNTTHSLLTPYVSGLAIKWPHVVPYVSSQNSTVTFSDFVRRLFTSLTVPTYHALYLMMDTPEEGWPAFFAAQELSKSKEKKPTQGAGTSRLDGHTEPLSPMAKQPKFE